MSFARWNQRLLDYFFGEFASGQRVRLAVSRDLFDTEFADLGGAEEFVRVVRQGPDWPVEKNNWMGGWVQPRHLVDRALGLYGQWKRPLTRSSRYESPPSDAPPYLPYLCLLCYAWTVDDDVAAHAYYERLNKLYPDHELNIQRHGLMQIARLHDLWEGLERWSRQQPPPGVGLFQVERLGAMPYIGLPKSQVMLTAPVLKRLPEFFAAIGLHPCRAMEPHDLWNRIVLHETASFQLLGNNLWRTISSWNDSTETSDTPDGSIGYAAMLQLLEHYAEWDGVVDAKPTRATGNAASGLVRRTGELLIALELVNDVTDRWSCEVYVAADELPSGDISFGCDGKSWAASLIDSVGGPFASKDGQRLDGKTLLCGGEGVIRGMWCDENDGEREVALDWQDARIRILNWEGSALIERRGLPLEGSSYLLISNDVFPNWERWRTHLPNGIVVNDDLPQQGIPDGWSLIYIEGLAAVSLNLRSLFPDGKEHHTSQKVLRASGGYRARQTGVRKVYLPYAPPKVILEAEGDVAIESMGAELFEEARTVPNVISGETPLPGSATRVFRVEPDAGTSVVSVWATRNNDEIGRICFGLDRTTGNVATSTSGFRVNSLGEPVTEGLNVNCVAGSHVFAEVESWQFRDGPYSVGTSGAPDLDVPGFQLLEWLALQGGRVSYVRARDFCAELLRKIVGSFSPIIAVKALWQLGHLELQVDSRGRWAYLHPSPCTLYTLPFKREGLYQVTVSGAATVQELEKIVSVAQANGVACELHRQLGRTHVAYQIVPPRICLLGQALDVFPTIAQECGVIWEPVPPAWKLACWAASIGEWIEHRKWYSEVGPKGEATYRPFQFRTQDGDHLPNPGTCKLTRQDDRVTGRHSMYKLEETGVGHTYVAHKAWGCWYVYRNLLRKVADLANAPPQKIPVAYERATNQIIVPFELEPPPLLARALAFCSGLASYHLEADEYPAYANSEYRFTPNLPYEGSCLGYPQVPKEIAKRVFAKLDACPLPFPP